MKLGLIGGGYWGKNLIRTFNELGNLNTICEINEELVEQYKTQYPDLNITTSFDTMLQNVDSVCVSVPAHLHHRFALQALNAGKHVYVEKPITLNLNEAIELEKVANEKNLILMVGHLLHYHNSVIELKNIIRSGKYGKIKYITSNRKSHGIYRSFENVLWSFAPHDISIALSLCDATFEDVNNINCTGSGHITENVQDIANLTFYANNIYVNINVDWNSPVKEQRLSVVCEKGILMFDDVEPTNKLKIIDNYVVDGVANKKEVEYVHVEGKSPLYNECDHFIKCCSTNTQPITPGNEGIDVLKVLMEADKSLNDIMRVVSTDSSSSYGPIYSLNTVMWNNASSPVHEETLTISSRFEGKVNNVFTHPMSANDSTNVGDGTKIWHFCNVTSDAVIGEKCNIGQNCYVAGTIGDNCKVQNNVSIYKGVKAGNNVFFGPSCVLTNDINPRCEHGKNGQYMETIIEDGVTIGANATIVCGKTIGKYALIGAGAVVCKNVEPYSIMVGNPAKKIGTVDEQGNRTLF